MPYDFTRLDIAIVIVAAAVSLAFPYLVWKWKGQAWVESKLDFLRDISTLLAVIFAASLSGWLTGGNLSLPFPSSETTTHPFLTPIVGVTAVAFSVSALLTLYADLKKKANT